MKISVIIRTLNESKHLGALLSSITGQVLNDTEVEIVIVDSGSSDGTLEIARNFDCKITSISKEEFTFGKSLNIGCEYSSGDILVFVSGHCVPVSSLWLQELTRPLVMNDISYVYGKQVGGDETRVSEEMIFAKYFPNDSKTPQDGFFCNNANSALRKVVWSEYRFNEELTGLEDMELAKRIQNDGLKIGYIAEAAVMHHHQENWSRVKNRFERESIALRTIMPEVQVTKIDTVRYIFSSIFHDLGYRGNGKFSFLQIFDIFSYRSAQYLGTYYGNLFHRGLSREAKERFFYPKI